MKKIDEENLQTDVPQSVDGHTDEPSFSDVAADVLVEDELEPTTVALTMAERRSRPSAREVAQSLGLTPQKVSTTLPVGTVIDDRYEVVRLLGVGAMGSVFLVNHTRLNKLFALKMIIPELAERTDFVARFEREADACSKLNHPNCISVTDFGHTADGSLYLVMEYVDGVPLSEVVRRGAVPVVEAIDYALQVLAGLEHAHGKGIVHRDIKLENVLRCQLENGETLLKILDFGMAKAPVRADENPAITKQGLVMGTPQYMAPEQLRNQPADQRSDLYSLGVTFFRLLTGKPIFKGDSVFDVLANKLNQPAPSLLEATNVAYPPSLEAFFQRALERNPDARYASAREMIDALQQVRETILAHSAVAPVAAIEERESEPSTVRPLPLSAERRIGFGDLFHRPLDDLVYWYTCGRSVKRANWTNRFQSLISDPIGKLVFIRFALLLMLLGIAGLLLMVTVGRNSSEPEEALPQPGDVVQMPEPSPEKAASPMPDVPAATTRRTVDTGVNQRSNEEAMAIDVRSDRGIPTKEDDAGSVAAQKVAEEPEPAPQGDASAAPSPPAPATVLKPPALDDTLQQLQRDIEAKKCSRAEGELMLYTPRRNADLAGAAFLKGRAAMCRGKYMDALKWYQKAIARDRRYRWHDVIGEDAKQMALIGQSTDKALRFMEKVLKEASLPVLVNFAGHAQRKAVRQQARAAVEKMGALNQVNLEASYDWDFHQAGSCQEKRTVIAKMAALQSKRAKMLLIRARDLQERDGIFKKRYVNECVRADINRAIADMRVTQ